MRYDRKKFFDAIRVRQFGGEMALKQVQGMEHKLDVWERDYPNSDPRCLANCLAQNYHETGAEMWPIEEYGKGVGKKYGKPDPVSGKIYYGRGDIQLTWAENYKKADKELKLTGMRSVYLYPANALDPEISAMIMFRGMTEGWFTGKKLGTYFSDARDDPYGARDIVNGDKALVPKWSNGVSIGNLIVKYHKAFYSALEAATIVSVQEEVKFVHIAITVPQGVQVKITMQEE